MYQFWERPASETPPRNWRVDASKLRASINPSKTMPRKYLGVIFRRARLCAARFRDRLSLKRTATTVRVNTLLWIYLQSGLVYSDGYIHDIEHGKPAASSRLDLGKYWWAWVDLNYRPRPYQGRALAT